MQIIPILIQKEVEPSDDLVELITSSTEIKNGDVVIVAQKVISKQEGRVVELSTVNPSLLAKGLASQYRKDPRIIELVLSESKRIVKLQDGIIIVQTHDGVVCANAGIDESNVSKNHATLLPVDPDESARRIRKGIFQRTRQNVAVIISDTFGRPFRMGQTNCAIGINGMDPILDYEGIQDSFGRTLRVTAIAVADELASAAELVMKKTLNCPVTVIRGYHFDFGEWPISKLNRAEDKDLFR